MMLSQSRKYYGVLFIVIVFAGSLMVFITAKSSVPLMMKPVSPLKLTPSMVTFTSHLNGNYDIFAYDLDTRLMVNLTKNLDSNEVFPAWSPDGNQLSFSKCSRIGVEYSVGGCVIYLWRVGEAPRQLTYPGQFEDDRQALWSPDDKRLAFFRRHGNYQALYVIKADGTDLRELCGGTTNCRDAVWSPDSEKLLFINSSRPYIAHLNTATFQKLDFNSTYLSGASWSPDSRQLVYGRSVPPKAKYELFVLDVATGVERQLTTGARKIAFPQWGPDGQQISFTAKFDRTFKDYSIRVDGTDLQFIGETAPLGGDFTAWSTDRNRAIFSRATKYLFPNVYESEVYVANADGSNSQLLLTWGGAVSNLQWRPRNS